MQAGSRPLTSLLRVVVVLVVVAVLLLGPNLEPFVRCDREVGKNEMNNKPCAVAVEMAHKGQTWVAGRIASAGLCPFGRRRRLQPHRAASPATRAAAHLQPRRQTSRRRSQSGGFFAVDFFVFISFF